MLHEANDGCADGPLEWDEAKQFVIAILQALRDPSEETIDTGMVAMHNSHAYDDAVLNAWQAMIDAITGEQK